MEDGHGGQWNAFARRAMKARAAMAYDLPPGKPRCTSSEGRKDRASTLVREAFMSVEADALTITMKALQRDHLDGALTWVKASRRQGRRQQASRSCQHYDRRAPL